MRNRLRQRDKRTGALALGDDNPFFHGQRRIMGQLECTGSEYSVHAAEFRV